MNSRPDPTRARDGILARIRQNRPAPVALPPADRFARPGLDLTQCFTDAVAGIGGEVVLVEAAGRAAALRERFPDAARVVAAAPGLLAEGESLDPAGRPHGLADLDVLVCRGALGVAENGAVWLPESYLGHRAAPFITQHLVLVLHRDDLVWNLHEAYARLDVAAEGFGVFVAGPSKTADIEQSLVIGAHGARSLTVFLEAG